jgi:uncharacterized protein YrrD
MGIQSMLHNLEDLQKCSIEATDGVIGVVDDLLFDDSAWVVRYLVVDAGTWLSSRKVLISPISIDHADWKDEVLAVNLSQEKVRNSPSINTDRPVSRQHELRSLEYYGYSSYWGGAGLWGGGYYPGLLMPGYAGPSSTFYAAQAETARLNAKLEAAKRQQDDDPHLRSAQTVLGYHLAATDGDIGHVAGVLVDDQTWALRYLVVETGHWWAGHQILIAPRWIAEVSWRTSGISVKLSRQAVHDAPAYVAAEPLSREAEMRIHEHYNYPGYWIDEPSWGPPHSGEQPIAPGTFAFLTQPSPN